MADTADEAQAQVRATSSEIEANIKRNPLDGGPDCLWHWNGARAGNATARVIANDLLAHQPFGGID